MKLIHMALAVIMTVLFLGCSSGGSSDGGVVYTGKTTPAVITATNAESMAGAGLNGSQSSSTVAVGALQGSAVSGIAVAQNIVGSASSVVQGVAIGSMAAGVIQTTSQTILAADVGAVSGSITLVGQIDDVTHLGTITMTYNQFTVPSGTVMNGVITIKVDAVDSLLNRTNATMTFTSFKVADATNSLAMGGSVHIITAGATDTMTLNFTIDSNGHQTKMENFVYVVVSSAAPNFMSESLSGRVYDSVEGYVDVSTTAPMLTALSTDLYPSSGGPFLVKGSNNTQVRLTPQNVTSVLVEADTTGDGIFDYSAVQPWSAI